MLKEIGKMEDQKNLREYNMKWVGISEENVGDRVSGG